MFSFCNWPPIFFLLFLHYTAILYTLLCVQVLVLAAALALASTAPAGPPAPYPAEPAYPDLPPVYNVSGLYVM